MKKLDINPSLLEAVNVKDFAALMQFLTNQNYFENVKVGLNRQRIIEDKRHDKMVTIEIDFQTWKTGQFGTGDTWTWTCYRAKDFSCSQQTHSFSKPYKLAKEYVTSPENWASPNSFIATKIEKENLDAVQVLLFLDHVNQISE